MHTVGGVFLVIFFLPTFSNLTNMSFRQNSGFISHLYPVAPDFHFLFSFLAKIPWHFMHSSISLFHDWFIFSVLGFFSLSLRLLYKLRKCQNNIEVFQKHLCEKTLKPQFLDEKHEMKQPHQGWKGLAFSLQLKRSKICNSA